MPLLGVAEWHARSSPLELVAFNSGESSRSVFSVDPQQLRPGAKWEDCVYPADRPRMRRFLDTWRVGNASRPIEYRLIVGDGEPLWVRHWVLGSSPDRCGRRKIQGVLMAIPEQKQLEQECLRMSERECHRVGQELHDDLSQVLTGLMCMTRGLARRLARESSACLAEVKDLGRELRGAATRVRAMAHGLFPAHLDYGNLRQALNEYARQIQARFPVRVSIEYSGRLSTHTPDQILQVFRVVQEAVGNSVHHGKARNVRILVTANRSSVVVRIEDDGHGFPRAARRPEGIGLHIMQYRARMLGGELRFRNLPRRGALVELKYPLHPASPSPVSVL